mgnify:CR=1 FL=1
MLRYSLILTLVGVASIVINLVVSRIISNKRMNITRVQLRVIPPSAKINGKNHSGFSPVSSLSMKIRENAGVIIPNRAVNGGGYSAEAEDECFGCTVIGRDFRAVGVKHGHAGVLFCCDASLQPDSHAGGGGFHRIL